MRTLAASELLEVWELGQAQQPFEQALLLIQAVGAESREEMGRWPIGKRDGALLELRERTFGSRIQALATCPACRATLELAFDTRAVRVPGVSDEGQLRSADVERYSVRFRLPTNDDVAAASRCGKSDEFAAELMRRCIVETRKGRKHVGVMALPAKVTAAIAARMAEADPQANVQLALSCPDCRTEWQCGFDVASFFWSEIAAWASRTLREVHVLASAYGWRESDILAMSTGRRQRYIEMVPERVQ